MIRVLMLALAFITLMGERPEVACPSSDPKTIRDVCDLRCAYRGQTPVCWWVAKPEQRT